MSCETPLLGMEIEWQRQPDKNWKQIIYGTLVDRETREVYERWIHNEECVSKIEYFRRKLCGNAHGKITNG